MGLLQQGHTLGAGPIASTRPLSRMLSNRIRRFGSISPSLVMSSSISDNTSNSSRIRSDVLTFFCSMTNAGGSIVHPPISYSPMDCVSVNLYICASAANGRGRGAGYPAPPPRSQRAEVPSGSPVARHPGTACGPFGSPPPEHPSSELAHVTTALAAYWPQNVELGSILRLRSFMFRQRSYLNAPIHMILFDWPGIGRS